MLINTLFKFIAARSIRIEKWVKIITGCSIISASLTKSLFTFIDFHQYISWHIFYSLLYFSFLFTSSEVIIIVLNKCLRNYFPLRLWLSCQVVVNIFFFCYSLNFISFPLCIMFEIFRMFEAIHFIMRKCVMFITPADIWGWTRFYFYLFHIFNTNKFVSKFKLRSILYRLFDSSHLGKYTYLWAYTIIFFDMLFSLQDTGENNATLFLSFVVFFLHFYLFAIF